MPFNNSVFIFYEGKMDKSLFERKIKKEFNKMKKIVHLQPYCEQDKKEVNKFIKTYKNSSDGRNYLLIADCDRKSRKRKIKELMEKYPDLDEGRIVLVVQMIEGWYLAGLTENNAISLCIDLYQFKRYDPNSIKKEEFCSLEPKNEYENKRAFYIAVANKFDLNIGITRNKSLLEFYNQHLSIL